MASIEYRPSNNLKNPWRVQVRKKGFPKTQKSFATKEDADRWAFEIESSMDGQKKMGMLPKFPLKIWIDRYRQEIGPSRQYWRKEIRYFDFWEKNLGDQTAIEISPAFIENHADQVLKTTGKNGDLLSFETRRKYLLMLSSLYTTAIRQWKWAIYNPLTGVDMLRRKDQKNKCLTKEMVPHYDEFKQKFCSMVKEKSEGLSQRDTAKKCGLSLHCYQYALDSKNNTTIRNFIKICNGLDIKVSIS